jgi:hypothetical protein
MTGENLATSYRNKMNSFLEILYMCMCLLKKSLYKNNRKKKSIRYLTEQYSNSSHDATSIVSFIRIEVGSLLIDSGK